MTRSRNKRAARRDVINRKQAWLRDAVKPVEKEKQNARS